MIKFRKGKLYSSGLACPNCKSADFRIRVRKQPKYRCRQCKTEFEEPEEKE